jgi:1,4-dihydroxy-2-naphthoate octaprenyltransferase
MFGWRVKDVPYLKTPYVAGLTALTGAMTGAVAGIELSNPGLQAVLVYLFLCKFLNSVMVGGAVKSRQQRAAGSSCLESSLASPLLQNDFRDVEGDAAEGVPTLPVLLGLGGCQALLLCLGLCAAYAGASLLHLRGSLLLPALLIVRLFNFDAKSHTPWRTNVPWNIAACAAVFLLDGVQP